MTSAQHSQSSSQPSHSSQPDTSASATLQLQIEGMTCQACASRIEKVLNKKPAIEKASVNFANETAQVNYDADQTNPEQILEWVAKTGYTAKIAQSDDLFNRDNEQESIHPSWRLWVIWLCLLPFLVGMVGMLFGSHALMPPVWLQFILATIVQFGLALPFYQSAWASIKGRLANMDVLVVLGTLTIWLYSTYMWLTHLNDTAHHVVYFEASVMVIAFVRLGKFLEERTKKQSLNSINLLLELTPKQVVVKQGKTWQTIDLSELQIGQIVLAKAGSRIACDGVVVKGEGWCDESHLTGESIALKKHIGSQVLAGAMVDNGSFEYKATALGKSTQLGDMIQALSEAQGSKANIARIADKVAAVFVPVVVAIAIITFIINYAILGVLDAALMRAVSVLVIACPCALGLATPAAIMAGMGVAARHGVWFKDAQALETTGQIDTVVLDKTGTLTEGRPSIAAHYLVDSQLQLSDVLALAASIETHANHPLATALVNAAKQQGLSLLSVSNIKQVTGEGIQGVIDGFGLVKVGRPSFANIDLPFLDKSSVDKTALEKTAGDETPTTQNMDNTKNANIWQIASIVAVSVNDVPLAAFALADDLKPDSQQAVKNLQNDGLNVVIMSGDNQSVVDFIAQQVQANDAFGQLSPREKANKIDLLQQAGRHVAMVGDGVNDAPAMATAQASFAMYQGTDIAQHSASARLLGDSLLHVDYAYQTAKATLANIKQNLFFAFIYNILGIPLAAFGLLNPMIAAAAMAMSSISVLLNALRLTRLKLSNDEKS